MEWYISAGGSQNIPLYSCSRSALSNEQWQKRGDKNPILGVAFILYGIFAELVYVAVTSVMLKKEYRKLSCYKIMLVLGAYDMLAIAVNSMLTGYFWLVGATYCSHPNLIFVTGAIGLGLWCGACMNCLVLVTNRLIDLWKPHLMPAIFGGNKTYFVLCLPLLYSFYFTMFTQPLLFSSEMTAWFFDPFILQHESELFHNIPHTINNLIVVVATCVLYAALCYVLMNKYHQEGTSISWAQKSIIIQSTCICMANLIAALIYVYMQFFPTPHSFILIGHVSWQVGHGMPAFVYLLMNKTIQREVLTMIGFRKMSPVVTISANQNSPTTFHI